MDRKTKTRGESFISFRNETSAEKLNTEVSLKHSAGHNFRKRHFETDQNENSTVSNALVDPDEPFGKSIKNDTIKTEVLSHDSRNKHSKVHSERIADDASSNEIEHRQRHNSGCRLRENSLNRNRGKSKTSHVDKGQINDSEVEKRNSDQSKRNSTEVLVSSSAMNRSSSVDKAFGKRTPSSDRTKKRLESPRNSFTDSSRRGQESPRRNLSSDRSRRMQNVSNDRSRRSNVSGDRNTTRGQESPRGAVMVQRAPKGIDTSLALGDLEGSDDEDSMSPRKSSPRKEIGSGLMQTTKSFEAKTSLIRRRDSDGSLTKVAQKQSSLTRSEIPPKPFIKKSLSNNPLKIDFIRKHSTGDDDDNDKTETHETIEQKPVLSKALQRSSSGRKLPTPNAHLRSLTSTLRKSACDVNEQLDNVEAIPKDGIDDDETFYKSSQTDTYQTVDFNDTKIVPSSPPEKKANLKRSVSLEIQPSNGSTNHNSIDTAVVLRKPPSPRDGRQTKPPLERKISARSASTSAVPASPRGTVPSPRGTKPPSPRAAKPPSPRNVSRTTVPSPRGSSVPSPRGTYRPNELVRKASLEKAVNSDKGLYRRNSGGSIDSHSKEIVRRTSSGTLGNFRSPRNTSPSKSGRKVVVKFDVLEINGIDDCVDLDTMLAKTASSAVANDEEQVIILGIFYVHNYLCIS